MGNRLGVVLIELAAASVVLTLPVMLSSCKAGNSERGRAHLSHPVLSNMGLRPKGVKRLTIGYGKELYVVKDKKAIAHVYDSVERGGNAGPLLTEDAILAFTTSEGQVAVLGFVYQKEYYPPKNDLCRTANDFKAMLEQIRASHLYDKVSRIPEFSVRAAQVLQGGHTKTVRRSRLRKVQDHARKLAMMWSPDSSIGCTGDNGGFLRSPDTKSAIILDLARPIASSVFIATIHDYTYDPAPGSPTWAGVYKELVYTKIAILREEWYVSLAFYSPTQAKWYLNGSIGGYSAGERDPVQEGYTRMYDQMLADSR